MKSGLTRRLNNIMTIEEEIEDFLKFFDNQHGMCEMHEWRELYAESTDELAKPVE